MMKARGYAPLKPALRVGHPLEHSLCTHFTPGGMTKLVDILPKVCLHLLIWE